MTVLPPKVEILGVPVTSSALPEVADAIVGAAMKGQRGYVCVASAHGITTARREPPLRDVLGRAMIVATDGMPLVWLLRWNGHSRAGRVCGPDLLPEICRVAEDRGVPVHFYGDSLATLDKLQQRLAKRFPRLVIAGAEAAKMLPARPALDRELVARLNGSGARIVFVGLSTPKQDYWMDVHSPHVDAVLIGVGAAIPFNAGMLKRAPRWMQHSGLEWLHRMLSEPRRLARRYLVTNARLVLDILRTRGR